MQTTKRHASKHYRLDWGNERAWETLGYTSKENPLCEMRAYIAICFPDRVIYYWRGWNEDPRTRIIDYGSYTYFFRIVDVT